MFSLNIAKTNIVSDFSSKFLAAYARARTRAQDRREIIS